MAKGKPIAKAVPGRSDRPCICVTMHTYDAFVTADGWNVSRYICTVCGIEHFQETIPPPDEAAETTARGDGPSSD